VAGKTITAVRVHHPRAVRRHEAGPADLTARLLNARVTGTGRRGKYLWLTLDDGSALVVHLGMSGQMLLGEVPNEGHLRIATLLDDGTALSFVDQRTFGGWMLADLVTVDGTDVPVPVAHLARDRSTRSSTATPSLRCCGASIPRSNGSCWTRPWFRASAISTPTRRCGGPRSTAPGLLRR
jgi:DNA-formamidopyrimidine glycosylase